MKPDDFLNFDYKDVSVESFLRERVVQAAVEALKFNFGESQIKRAVDYLVAEGFDESAYSVVKDVSLEAQYLLEVRTLARVLHTLKRNTVFE